MQKEKDSEIVKRAAGIFCTTIFISFVLLAPLARCQQIGTSHDILGNTTVSSLTVGTQDQNLSDTAFYRQSLDRNGFAATEGPETPDVLWTSNLNDSVTTSPVAADGKVFDGTSTGKFYALDQTTGDIVWMSDAGCPIVSSPAFQDGVVFFGTENPGKIYALDADTGIIKWLYNVPSGAAVYSSPAVVEGKVIVGTSDGNLLCLDEEGGQVLWSTQLGSGYISSAAIQNDTAFVASTFGVYAVDVLTGTLVWEYATSWPVTSCPAVADGLVFVGSENNDRIYALDEDTGQPLWILQTGGWLTPPAVDSSKHFVIDGSKDLTLYCLNEQTGSVEWKYVSPVAWEYVTSNLISDPTISDNGLVYYGTYDGSLFCINEDTGEEVWTYNLSAPIASSVNVISGHLFVASQDGEIYCFGSPFTFQNIAITSLTESNSEVGQGYNLNINATVQNTGDAVEMFNVTAYANATAIETNEVTLMNGSSTSVTFVWDTTSFAYGNYTISACATSVPGQTNTTGNNFFGGWVTVTIPGDLNGDFTVNLLDLVILAQAYGSTPGSPNWNPNADIDGKGVVGLTDLVILVQHYGQHYP